MSTLPHTVGTDRARRVVSPPDGLDPCTDDGLRQAVRAVCRSGSWDHPAGRRLLAEIRRRAVRNAAHIASATGVPTSRGLVDDVLLAAWMVIHRHGDKVLAADRTWAYLMSSAQKQVLDEVRAQQLLTNTRRSGAIRNAQYPRRRLRTSQGGLSGGQVINWQAVPRVKEVHALLSRLVQADREAERPPAAP